MARRRTRCATPGIPVIIVTMRGAKSGKVRKIALMRVEHEGDYALVASYGGAPQHPVWYHNLVADPDAVQVQDGPEPFDVTVREVDGRRASGVVGSRRRRLPQLRRVPGEDRAPDPGARRQPSLSDRLPSADSARRVVSARPGTARASHGATGTPHRSAARRRGEPVEEPLAGAQHDGRRRDRELVDVPGREGLAHHVGPAADADVAPGRRVGRLLHRSRQAVDEHEPAGRIGRVRRCGASARTAGRRTGSCRPTPPPIRTCRARTPPHPAWRRGRRSTAGPRRSCLPVTARSRTSRAHPSPSGAAARRRRRGRTPVRRGVRSRSRPATW